MQHHARVPTGSAWWIGDVSRLAYWALAAPAATRVAVSLPTTDLVSAVAVTEALHHRLQRLLAAPLDCPTSGDENRYASVATGGGYEDLKIRAVTGDSVRVGPSTFTRNIDAVRVLPETFPASREPRTPRRLKQSIEDAWAEAAGIDGDGPRLHAKASAHPLVFIGSPEQFKSETVVLEGLWPPVRSLLDPTVDPLQWLRHPVVVLSYAADPEPWLADLTPSLVVACGVAAWRSRTRRMFPKASQLWLVDRCSGVASEAVEDLMLSHPKPLSSLPPPVGGADVFAFEERSIAPDDDNPDEF